MLRRYTLAFKCETVRLLKTYPCGAGGMMKALIFAANVISMTTENINDIKGRLETLRRFL